MVTALLSCPTALKVQLGIARRGSVDLERSSPHGKNPRSNYVAHKKPFAVIPTPGQGPTPHTAPERNQKAPKADDVAVQGPARGAPSPRALEGAY